MREKKRDWLIKLRQNRKLEQQDVSELIGVTQQFYNYIENGKRRPSPDVAIKIGNVLNFDWRLFYEKKSKLEKEE
jgi:transcriptional regulator with XRE-family HTH domain